MHRQRNQKSPNENKPLLKICTRHPWFHQKCHLHAASFHGLIFQWRIPHFLFSDFILSFLTKKSPDWLGRVKKRSFTLVKSKMKNKKVMLVMNTV